MSAINKSLVADVLTYSAAKIFFFNLFSSLHLKLVDADLAKTFVTKFLDCLVETEQEINNEVLKTELENLIRDEESHGSGLLLQAQIETKLNNINSSYYLSFKDYEKLYYHVLKPTKLKNGDTFVNPRAKNFEKKFEVLRKLFFNTAITLPKWTSLSRDHSVIWVCPEEDFNGLEQITADNVRDYLGLSHIDGATFVFGLAIKRENLACEQGNDIAKRPTPLDAGAHDRFKVMSEIGKTNGHEHETGFTFDLSSRDDGGRELVVVEQKAKKISTLKIFPIGKTEKDPPDFGENDVEFVDFLRNDFRHIYGLQKNIDAEVDNTLIDLVLELICE